ncbi:T9SS type B sorting domain-containing protein [Pareuzebyella sediminis]|uniref:T9SS type B sorting domain-containing protein n=1 Tax=Pareuzebyella sediminis TaxID=2607998 RepID=UPI0011EF2999|nr:gliding motility-associated C-terminal domain-containing protein [Pareuzebyella sediminis]
MEGNSQFLLQAPNSGDETNYRWYEASDNTTVLGTDFYYEVTQPGVYFATYDGTICGHNATGYFIVTNCNAPYNEVTLDISANPVPSGASLTWSPAVSGNQNSPTVTATQTVVRYTATITKAGNAKSLPNFTVVCMDQSATLVDDLVTVDEDESVVVDIYANDSDLPGTGTLMISSSPNNGIVNINNNNTPNDPTDDVVTYIPNSDYNGADTFDYTVCNTFGDCSTATVTVDVIPVLDALDDTFVTLINTPLDIAILDNDNDLPSTGTLSVTNSTDGAVFLNDNGTPNNPSDDFVSYTPNTDFLGTDSFTYTLCDTSGNCSTATVTVMVNTPGVDLDSDDDGIVDSFEDLNLDGDNDPSTNATDTDNDGIADYLDIDSDNDGIPDNVEAQSTIGYIPPSGVDANGNGLDDMYEGSGTVGIIPEDTDGDGLPDYVDEDSDNDNIPDNIEAHDHDQNGIPEATLIGSDKDNDGLDDGYEGSVAIDLDVNDEINDPYNDLPNTDGDGQSDYRDTDDDDDGIQSKDEDTNTDGIYSNDDSDNDGIPEYLEANIIETGVDVINVMTLNDDGVHDTLRIDGIENYPNNTIKIYNRWGVLVFSTNAYDNTNNYFDGTSQGRVTVDANNKLPVGTYFYILDYEDSTGNKITDTGYIYINR